MSDISGALKGLLVGRPMRSDRLGRTLLPKPLVALGVVVASVPWQLESSVGQAAESGVV